MLRCRTMLTVVAFGAVVFAAVPANGATGAQFGQKCKAAWRGATGTAAFGAYQSRCVRAAIEATGAATDAGNPGNATANRSRSARACASQFPPPRNTAAKRAAFNSCVKAGAASQLAFAGRPLRATLSGQNEVPASGSATGSAVIRLNQGRKRVCYTVNVAGLNGSPVSAAHIHEGAAGAVGNPVVALGSMSALDSGGPAVGCVEDVAPALIKAIRDNPAAYYVNVHTAAFPGGAARGQLAR